MYSVIQKDELNFVCLYFLNCKWYVNDLHNIWKRRSYICKYHRYIARLVHSRAVVSFESKMATVQHKIFCVRDFIKTESPTAVRRAFRLRFNIQPPTRKSICRWNHQFEQTGCLCKGKSSGRPRVSEENVRRIQGSFERVYIYIYIYMCVCVCVCAYCKPVWASDVEYCWLSQVKGSNTIQVLKMDAGRISTSCFECVYVLLKQFIGKEFTKQMVLLSVAYLNLHINVCLEKIDR